jgi:hypothetical protein
VARLTGQQNLLDSVHEPITIGEHDRVKVFSLPMVQLSRLQGFQVEADGGERRFELMSYGIDKGIVLFIAFDLTYQEGGVKNQADNDHREEDDAKNQKRDLPPV